MIDTNTLFALALALALALGLLYKVIILFAFCEVIKDSHFAKYKLFSITWQMPTLHPKSNHNNSLPSSVDFPKYGPGITG